MRGIEHVCMCACVHVCMPHMHMHMRTLGASVRSRGRSSGIERRWYQMGCSVRSMTAVSRSTPQAMIFTYGSARPLLSAGCMSRLARAWRVHGVRVACA